LTILKYSPDSLNPAFCEGIYILSAVEGVAVWDSLDLNPFDRIFDADRENAS